MRRILLPRFSGQELALVVVTMVWGSTFLVVHLAMEHSGPLFFVGVRFAVAAAFAAILFHRSLPRIGRRELLAGGVIGVAVFAGYTLQTAGLQTIESSMSAFLTALYVPIVPLLQWLVLRRPPRAITLVGVALAFAGMLLLAGPSAAGFSLGPGELVTLASAGAFAAEILLISFFAGKVDLGGVLVIQLAVASLLGFVGMPVLGEPVPAFSWGWLIPAVAMGLASGLIQLTMNWAQKSVSPTRATLIYASEPVWGGAVGLLAGDRMGPLGFVGAALILAGIVVSELRPRSAPEESPPPPDGDPG